ncbi:MAG: preprotein translocase subunit SecE [Dehalococcoidia bacterium]|nr:preprotein translocase subunit SecE [Dehalococcoidia bacterium]MDH4367267.1 preprotein translocase subunit SecE [Dehalococcoidia bacterium]
MTTRANKAATKAAPEKKSRFRFFADVVAELRKAHWPTRQEALRLSILVLAVAVVLGLILGVLDLGFTRLFLLLGG